jgi:hypothetical protein
MRGKMMMAVAGALLCGLMPQAGWTEEQETEASSSGGMQPEFVLNVRPASLLMDMQGDKFKAGGISASELFYMPNLDAGVGLVWDQFALDLTGGGGVLLNDQFHAVFIDAVVAGMFSVKDTLSIGPRIGLVQFLNPEWSENDDVNFDETTGFLAGIQMSLGDKISYLFSVDYIGAAFDAKAAPGVAMSDDKMDISGLTLQFGVRGEF